MDFNVQLMDKTVLCLSLHHPVIFYVRSSVLPKDNKGV
jgi:hypothetical protein